MMPDRQTYNVTIDFAHGVRYEFKGLTPAATSGLMTWMEGRGGEIKEFHYEGKTYYCNRDYVCGMIVE